MLWKNKGVLVLLDALKILKERGYSFVCNFVGGETAEIDATRFAEEVEKRGLNNMAIYLGKKYGAEKNEEYRKSDVFVFPSLNEAFPLVNLEAMEFKLPIVASGVGGVTAEIKDGENGGETCEVVLQYLLQSLAATHQGDEHKHAPEHAEAREQTAALVPRDGIENLFICI